MNSIGIIDPPLHWEDWYNLVKHFAEHLGFFLVFYLYQLIVMELSKFPNGILKSGMSQIWRRSSGQVYIVNRVSLAGGQDGYFTMYNYTSTALKSVKYLSK